MVLADLTNTVKLDTGAVRKIYTLDGHPVNSLIDLKVNIHTLDGHPVHFLIDLKVNNYTLDGHPVNSLLGLKLSLIDLLRWSNSISVKLRF